MRPKNLARVHNTRKPIQLRTTAIKVVRNHAKDEHRKISHASIVSYVYLEIPAKTPWLEFFRWKLLYTQVRPTLVTGLPALGNRIVYKRKCDRRYFKLGNRKVRVFYSILFLSNMLFSPSWGNFSTQLDAVCTVSIPLWKVTHHRQTDCWLYRETWRSEPVTKDQYQACHPWWVNLQENRI